jgi:hypothetical protein
MEPPRHEGTKEKTPRAICGEPTLSGVGARGWWNVTCGGRQSSRNDLFPGRGKTDECRVVVAVKVVEVKVGADEVDDYEAGAVGGVPDGVTTAP